MARDDQLSIRPKVLLLLFVIAALAAVLAFQTIRAVQAPTGPSSPSPGSSDVATGADARFDISGHVAGLAPGLTRALAVTFTNPNAVPIHVTELTVAIAPNSTPSGCSSVANLSLRQAAEISEEEPVVVPAGERITVRTPPRAPTLSFLHLPVAQDECKNVSFELTFTGRAHG